ncbi:MAG: four helix bundle protein [Deltaproteobacteria bacterium]|nr:four helix bundle protein [Deltaproteobacteria bacterium]
MDAMQSFTKLRVWQAAYRLTMDIYRVTRSFPPEERYGLTAQVCSSAVSVMSNIAEASASRWPADFSRILNNAEKEAAETLSHLFVARGLSYLDSPTAQDLIARTLHIRRMLYRLQEKVKAHVAHRARRTAPPEPRSPSGPKTEN